MDNLKLLISLLPTLISLVKTIEIALPEKGNGATKLAMVREILTALNDGVPAAWPMIETTINAIVKAFNLTGKLGK
jgi:hypothetical protein